MRLTHEACGLLYAGVYSTVHMHIHDYGILDVTERSAIVLVERTPRRSLREGQRIATAVEGALERVGIAGSRHCRYLDVGVQLHELAVEGITIGDVSGEIIPLASVTDDVRAALCACTREGKGNIVRKGNEKSLIINTEPSPFP